MNCCIEGCNWYKFDESQGKDENLEKIQHCYHILLLRRLQVVQIGTSNRDINHHTVQFLHPRSTSMSAVRYHQRKDLNRKQADIPVTITQKLKLYFLLIEAKHFQSFGH